MGNFSYLIHTILCGIVIVCTFECQAWITMVYIKQKYKSKFLFKCVILRSKILQKVGMFLSEHCEWDACNQGCQAIDNTSSAFNQ